MNARKHTDNSVACDVASHLYSFSFEPNSNWTREYPSQAEILNYLVNISEKYNLYNYTRFGTTALSARWNDTTNQWSVELRPAAGTKESEYHPSTYVIICQFLVTGVGQLNVPKYPDLGDLSKCKARIMHSARWDSAYEWTSKRVAVIGSGATAAQIIPELQKTAAHVDVFQRTPNWILPRDDRPISKLWQAIYRYIPGTRALHRAGIMRYREAFYEILKLDSTMGIEAEKLHKAALMAAFPSNKKMRAKLTPTYPPGCKRIVLSDDFFPALASANVSLITDRLLKLTESGISGSEGEYGPYDLIVYATGFQTSEFLHSLEIYGRDGLNMREIWRTSGPEAYYGITMRGMPNLGMLYGANTNLGHNSIILMIEEQARYVAELVRLLIGGRAISIEVAQSAVKGFNEELQARLPNLAFSSEVTQHLFIALQTDA